MNVQFQLPEYVNPVDETLDDAEVTIAYDSTYGSTVEKSGTAEISAAEHPSDWTTLVVGDRYVRSNGHVFNGDGRHLGTVEEITVTTDEETALDLVTRSVDADIDRHDDNIVVQTWDSSVMDEDGFMAGTDEVRMEHVC